MSSSLVTVPEIGPRDTSKMNIIVENPWDPLWWFQNKWNLSVKGYICVRRINFTFSEIITMGLKDFQQLNWLLSCHRYFEHRLRNNFKRVIVGRQISWDIEANLHNPISNPNENNASCKAQTQLQNATGGLLSLDVSACEFVGDNCLSVPSKMVHLGHTLLVQISC